MAAHQMLGVSAGQMVIALDPTTDTRFMTDITVAQLRRHVEALSASEGQGDDAKVAIREILRCAQIYAAVIDPEGSPTQPAGLALPAPPTPLHRSEEAGDVVASERKNQSLVLRQKKVAKQSAVEQEERSPATDSTLAATEAPSEPPIREQVAVERELWHEDEEAAENGRQKQSLDEAPRKEAVPHASEEEATVEATPAQPFTSPVQSLNAYPQYDQPYYTQGGLFVPPQHQTLYIPPQQSTVLIPSQSHDLVQWSDVTDIPLQHGTTYPGFQAQQCQEQPRPPITAQPRQLSVKTIIFTPGAPSFVPWGSSFVPGINPLVPESSSHAEKATIDKTSNEDPEDYVTLYVGNLGDEVTDDVLYDKFSECYCVGLKSAHVVATDKVHGGPRGFGYVDFETHEQAKAALSKMHGIELHGREMRLNSSQRRVVQHATKFANTQKKMLPVADKGNKPISESASTPQTDPIDRIDSPSTETEANTGRREAKRLRELRKASSRGASPAKIEATTVAEFTFESPSSSPMISSAASVVDNAPPGSSAGEEPNRSPGDEAESDEWKPVTRYTPSIRELELVVWVPREDRDPPASTLEPVDKTAWFNAQYETITNIKAHKAHVTDLGHILALFPCAEDRDEFKANASQWLKSGRTIIDEFFDIEAIIEDINTYRYLAGKLVNPAGKQAVFNRILRQNFATIPDAQILRIEWAGGKQHRPLEPKNFVKDSIIITFDSAMDANAILEHNLILKEDSLLTFIHRTQLPMLQCNHCGRLGHHEARCWYAIRCLKCTQPHATATCRLRPESWKCLLCYKPHHSRDSVCAVRKQEKEWMESKRPPLGHFHQTSSAVEDAPSRAAEHVPHGETGDPNTGFDDHDLSRSLNERPRLVQMVEDWQEKGKEKGEEDERSGMREGEGEGEDEAQQLAPGQVGVVSPQQNDSPVTVSGYQDGLAHFQAEQRPENDWSTNFISASEDKQVVANSLTTMSDLRPESNKSFEKSLEETNNLISKALPGAPETTAQSSNAIENSAKLALEAGKSYPIVMGAIMLAPTPIKHDQSTILEDSSAPPSAPTMPKAVKRDAARVDSPIGYVSATMHKKQKLSDSSIPQSSGQQSVGASVESDEKTLGNSTSPIKNVAQVPVRAKQTTQEQVTAKSPSSAEQTPTRPVFTPIITEVLKRTIISKSTPSPKPVATNALQKPKPLPTRYTSTVEELQLYVSLPGHERQTLAAGTDKTDWLNAVIDGHTSMKAVQATVTGLQHLLITFDSAEDRDDFIKDGKKWLKGGRRVMKGTYDVQLTINETRVMMYLSSELLKQSSRAVVRQIMLENQGIIPNATILRIGWNPKKGPRSSASGDIKNLKPADQPAIFVTFDTAEDANAALDKGLTILGKKCSVSKYLHKYTILQCLNCGALGHHTARCWEDTRCLKCGEAHHTDKCVNPESLNCVLCERAHDSRVNDCKIRQQEQNFVRTGLMQNMTSARF